MSTQTYIIDLKPRYLLFNNWKRLTFNELSADIKNLYIEQGINMWMTKNVKDAFRREGLQVEILNITDAHEMAISLSVKQDDLTFYKSYFDNDEEWQVKAICHLLEQKKDFGNDGAQWAYGVSVDATIKDRKGNELCTMVFHISDITKV